MESDFETESSTCIHDELSLQALISWWGQEEPEDDPIPQVTSAGNWDGESFDDHSWKNEDEYPELLEYREVLINSPAYSWLASQLTAELLHETLGDDCRSRIHEAIINMLDTRTYTINRKLAPPSVKMRFHVSWNPLEFFKDQAYGISPREALPRILVLTGVANNIQSSTAAEYISRVWPYYGPQILRLCQDVLSEEIDGLSSC